MKVINAVKEISEGKTTQSRERVCFNNNCMGSAVEIKENLFAQWQHQDHMSNKKIKIFWIRKLTQLQIQTSIMQTY